MTRLSVSSDEGTTAHVFPVNTEWPVMIGSTRLALTPPLIAPQFIGHAAAVKFSKCA